MRYDTRQRRVRRTAVNKTELIVKLAKKMGIAQKDAHAIVDGLFGQNGGIIPTELQRGHTVQLTGFGIFETRTREESIRTHPQTGDRVRVEKRRVPAFRPARGLKDRVK